MSAETKYHYEQAKELLNEAREIGHSVSKQHEFENLIVLAQEHMKIHQQLQPRGYPNYGYTYTTNVPPTGPAI